MHHLEENDMNNLGSGGYKGKRQTSCLIQRLILIANVENTHIKPC